MNEWIKEKLAVLPAQPGCYLMKDKHGTVIYVGKSKMLRNRVKSYFIGANDQKKHNVLSEKFMTLSILSQARKSKH